MQLVTPTLAHLPAYVDALRRGWSADNVRGEAAAREELVRIAADAPAFVALHTDREALGGPVTLPDGSVVMRIPGLPGFAARDRGQRRPTGRALHQARVVRRGGRPALPYLARLNHHRPAAGPAPWP